MHYGKEQKDGQFPIIEFPNGQTALTLFVYERENVAYLQ